MDDNWPNPNVLQSVRSRQHWNSGGRVQTEQQPLRKQPFLLIKAFFEPAGDPLQLWPAESGNRAVCGIQPPG